MDFSKIFIIDWYRFGRLLVPPFLRKIKHIVWIYSLLKPIEDLSLEFRVFRENSIYRVTHNGQVFSLENILNDQYDKSSRRIFITDSLDLDASYVYPESDNKIVIINSEASDEVLRIYSEASIRAAKYDFIVNIPIDLKPSSATSEKNLTTQISGSIDIYKLASKKYKITWI